MDAETKKPEAEIIVARTSPQDVQQRQIVVKLDGKEIGELMYGETLKIPVKAGRHRLKVDNTWNWKTVELDVAAGEHARFQTISKAGKLTWFLVSLIGAGPNYVSIEREA